MFVQYMAWAVLICRDPLLPLPQDAFCHTPSFHPPFKGITVRVYQHLLRLFHLQHLIRPAPGKEVRRQRAGAGWPQDAAATAPGAGGRRGLDPPPLQTLLLHTPGMRNWCWCLFFTKRGGLRERKQSED